jgi:hypothetical protein
MEPLISIVIVGMNHANFLRNLFPSLKEELIHNFTDVGECPKNNKNNYEIIYVDNCSSDDSLAYVRANYPETKIIENTKPLGFGENNNNGVKASIGEYVAIINPDIEIRSNSLYILIDYLKNHPDVGIVAPKLLNPDGTIQYSARGFINLKRLVARCLTFGKDKSNNTVVNDYLCKNIDLSLVQPVDWLMGAALLLRRDKYIELNGFDTDYFLYMEDEDLCYRSWKAGYPVVYNPKAEMVHNHQRASSRIGKKMWIHMKSMCTFFRKNGLNAHR